MQIRQLGASNETCRWKVEATKQKKETLLHGLPTEAGNYFPQVNFYMSLNVLGQISGKKKKVN